VTSPDYLPCIGVDEAGRGALAGPVVAAAVWLDPDLDSRLFCDSKTLSSARRDELYSVLINSRSRIGIGSHSHVTVDRVNILTATMSAMNHAVCRIDAICASDKTDHWLKFGHDLAVIIDGNRVPQRLKGRATALVKGDRLHPSISAASIVAKVVRDRIMVAMSTLWPNYEFDVNKGYGTQRHYRALSLRGPSPVHRRTFNLTIQDRLF